jgi:hypothetical protein
MKESRHPHDLGSKLHANGNHEESRPQRDIPYNNGSGHTELGATA